jgi:exosortase J
MNVLGRFPERLHPRLAVLCACVCAVVGLLIVQDSVRALLGIWRTDALKSMGMVVPFVCFALILRAWRALGWETEGSWWGLAILGGAALLLFVRSQMLLIITVNKDWLLQLPPLPLVAVVYATGLVLLFGGPRLLRAAWFPVLLMWAVIPVPQLFSHLVDLPLQHVGAETARGFAHLIGQKLDDQDLQIMFAPGFGMFIAPGCDGLRGSITLGLTALVVGHVYRFRWYLFAPVVIAAVLLGYVFNLLRLCSLVVFDKIALSLPWLQTREQIADHIVGAGLFLTALLLFFSIVDRLRHDKDLAEAPEPPQRVEPGPPALAYLSKVAAVVALAALFGIDSLRAAPPAPVGEAKVVLAPMPQQIGGYTLVRTWTESDPTLVSIVVYTWGEYAAPDAAVPHVSLGISPVMGVHDAEVCHIARGEEPTWHGQIEADSPGGGVSLTAATYRNGTGQDLEASTVCDGGSCRQFSETGRHVTLIYAKPHRALPLEANQTRPVPVLLKVETTDTTTPVGVEEPRLASALAQFLKSADLVTLTTPYSRQ